MSDLEARTDRLLRRLSLQEKAGLMFHAVVTIGPDGAVQESDPRSDRPGAAELIRRGITHMNVVGTAPARQFAQWHNTIQAMASDQPSEIPVTVSSDPRHSFGDNPGTAIPAGRFSQWPEPLGIGAIGDPDVARRFGDAVRREYTAVGIRVALHPQLDLATEPRWARVSGCFGDDSGPVAELAAAYIRGLQGETFGPTSVSAMIKHFPGGGAQKDGEDPHFPYGREQVYPASNWDAHLQPFRKALAAGARQVMPGYGLPIGTPWPEIGFGFSRPLIEGVLREELGFDGVVCADWGIVHDSTFLGHPFPARAWGVEHLAPRDRMRIALDAGIDQFGGEYHPEMIVDLVESGDISEERIDQSARRLLREKLALGLFDDKRSVDPDEAEDTVGASELVAQGRRAQSRSIVVLRDGADARGRAQLPLDAHASIWIEGIDQDTAAQYASVAASLHEADVAVVRLPAPYEPRGIGTFEEFFHTGRLWFDSPTVERLRAIADQVPLVIVVNAERPPILGDLTRIASVLAVEFGASDPAVLDALYGRERPEGALPVGLPRDPAVLERHPADVALDAREAEYPRGYRAGDDRPEPRT